MARKKEGFDAESVNKSDYIAAFDGNVKDAADALKIAASTLYGYPDEPNYRIKCAMVTACNQAGRGQVLRAIIARKLLA